MAGARGPGRGTPAGLPDRLQGDAEYLFKAGPVDLADGRLLSGIVDFFAEGIAADKGVLELIGTDVAAFCDDLIKDSRTYAGVYQESIVGKPGMDEK